jgi:hypothetical protein
MKAYYERAKNLSVYWTNRANDFHASALVTWEAMDRNSSEFIINKLGEGFKLGIALPPVFSYLCATSLELILKACLIELRFKQELINMFKSTNKKTIYQDEVNFELEQGFFTHDLCKLSKDINLALTNKEQILIKILTNVLYWHGKYPIPKNKKIYSEFSSILDGCMVGSERLEKTGSKLRGKTFDPEICLNLDNYEKIWLKIANHFSHISIKI